MLGHAESQLLTTRRGSCPDTYGGAPLVVQTAVHRSKQSCQPPRRARRGDESHDWSQVKRLRHGLLTTLLV